MSMKPNGIAGDQAHQREDDDGDGQDEKQRLDEPAKDVVAHGFPVGGGLAPPVAGFVAGGHRPSASVRLYERSWARVCPWKDAQIRRYSIVVSRNEKIRFGIQVKFVTDDFAA